MTLHSKALAYATIGVIWLVVAMTILTELHEPFKLLLTDIAGHHWTGKSIMAVVAFVVLYLLLRHTKESRRVLTEVLFTLGNVIAGGLVIFSFFLSRFLGA